LPPPIEVTVVKPLPEITELLPLVFEAPPLPIVTVYKDPCVAAKLEDNMPPAPPPPPLKYPPPPPPAIFK
jgi:hypothetical protein